MSEKLTPALRAYPLGNWLYHMSYWPGLSFAHLPGVVKQNAEYGWHVPEDCLPMVRWELENSGFELHVQPRVDAVLVENHPKLLPHQNAGVKRILTRGSTLLNFEMRMGKTPTTCVALSRIRPVRTLIVCPALVRDHWESELNRWYPEHVKIVNMRTSEDAAPLAEPSLWTRAPYILITSYHLLQKIPLKPWDVIVLDESHYIKNENTKCATLLDSIGKKNQTALKILLSGTPMTIEPTDLYNQLAWMHTYRWGSFWGFASRYCNIEEGEYGKKITGLNPDTQDELESRLKYVSLRATRKELAGSFAASTVIKTIMKPEREDIRELVEHFSSTVQLHKESIDQFSLAAAPAKVQMAAQRVMEDWEAGHRYIAVLAYHRDTAVQIVKVLKAQGLPVELVSGDTPIKKRLRKIEQACLEPGCILVATMKAVNEGISLSHFNRVLVAEMYPAPKIMLQALGRFPLLGSLAPIRIEILILRGTVDEIIADVLEQRLIAINRLVAPGAAETELGAAVSSTVDDDWYAALRKAANSRVREDIYV